MKRMVKAAESEDRETIFKDKLDQIADDFDYLMDGLQHVSIEDADKVADSINDSIQSCIAEIASIISE